MTRIRGRRGDACPEKARREGRVKRWNVTSAEAGFPGKAKTRTLFSVSAFLSVSFEGVEKKPPMGFVGGTGTVAKVVGLPGFISTRPKWIVPPRERSRVGFRRSSSPMETPPVVIRTSISGRIAFKVVAKSCALKETIRKYN